MSMHGTVARLAPALLAGWIGLTLSVMGDQLLDFSVLFEAANSTDLSVGWIGLAAGLPVLAAGLLGSLVDRWRRRMGLLLCLPLVLSAVGCILVWIIWPNPGRALALYAVLAALATFAVIITTSWNVAIPAVVGERPEDIKKAVATTALVLSLGAAAGPAAGAVLVGAIDVRTLALIDAFSFLLCALAMRSVARVASARAIIASSPSTLTKVSLTQGATLILGNRRLRSPVLAVAVMNMVVFGLTFAFPLLVVDRGWSLRVIGVLASALLVGTLVGSAVGVIFTREEHFTAYLVAEPAARAIGLTVLLLAPSPVIAAVGCFLVAAPQGVSRVARQTLLLTEFPGEQRGRVTGAYQMLIRGAMPLAPPAMAVLVAAAGVNTYLVVTITLLLILSAALVADRPRMPSSRRSTRCVSESTSPRATATPSPRKPTSSTD